MEHHDLSSLSDKAASAQEDRRFCRNSSRRNGRVSSIPKMFSSKRASLCAWKAAVESAKSREIRQTPQDEGILNYTKFTMITVSVHLTHFILWILPWLWELEMIGLSPSWIHQLSLLYDGQDHSMFYLFATPTKHVYFPFHLASHRIVPQLILQYRMLCHVCLNVYSLHMYHISSLIYPCPSRTLMPCKANTTSGRTLRVVKQNFAKVSSTTQVRVGLMGLNDSCWHAPRLPTCHTISERSTKYNKHDKTETRVWKTMPWDTDSALPCWQKQKHFVSTWISLNQHVTCMHRNGWCIAFKRCKCRMSSMPSQIQWNQWNVHNVHVLSKLRIISNDRHNFITWEIRQPSKVLVAYTQLGRQILSPRTAISFHVADPHFPGRVSNITILASTDFPQKLLQQLFFPGLKDVRIEGHLVPQQTRKKKRKKRIQCDRSDEFALHLHVPRFIARAKSNWTSCIITSSSATSTLPGRPVLTSTRLHTNPKYQNCQSQRKKCLPTSWSLSLTPL